MAPSWRTLLSALLIAGAFPPWDLHWIVWVALIPWLSCLKRVASYRQAVVQGFWLSFSVGVLVAHWLSVAIHEFLGVSWPVAVLGLVVFAAVGAQPQFLIFAPVVRWIESKTGPGHPEARASLSASRWTLVTALGLACCYSALDAFVPRLFDVGLGYALHAATNLRQLAELGGVALLTFGIVLVNLLGWEIAERIAEARTRESRPTLALLREVACIALLLSAASVYGMARNAELATLAENPDRVLRVAVVQGNVANDVRLAWARGDERAAERQLSPYMLLTEEFIEQTPRPDLVVWPEATFPGVFRQPGSKLQEGRGIKFDRQVLRLNVPIVFGAYDMVEEEGRRTLFNTLFSITPDYDHPGHQGFVQRYHKHKLLPFAETIPGLSQSGWLHRLLPSLGFFGQGPGAKVLRILNADGRSLQVAPIICSESLHAQHVIESARKGGQLIINIGSDGWFGPYGEPQFHLAIARFRSIETRLPQIRSANTGISALILPSGEISGRSEFGEKRSLNLEVPIGPAPKTRMVDWGDWFARMAGVLAAGFVLLHVLTRPRQH